MIDTTGTLTQDDTIVIYGRLATSSAKTLTDRGAPELTYVPIDADDLPTSKILSGSRARAPRARLWLGRGHDPARHPPAGAYLHLRDRLPGRGLAVVHPRGAPERRSLHRSGGRQRRRRHRLGVAGQRRWNLRRSRELPGGRQPPVARMG